MSYLRLSMHHYFNDSTALLAWRTAIRSALAVALSGLIGVGSYSAYAAPMRPSDSMNTAKITTPNAMRDNADLPQIANMLELADDIDDPDNDIDGVADSSALEEDTFESESDEMSLEIPEEVSGISLNAISPDTIKTFVKVVGLVRREYVDDVNDETLFNNAISGMLTKLDSHAEFLDVEAYDNLRAFTQGDVGDIGITAMYQPEAGYWIVTYVIPDSSADKTDIDVGDYLHQIDEFELDENNQSNDIKQLLTGIAGTQVDIVTSRAGRRKHTTTLQRNNNNPKKIETRLVDGIAVIKLPVFQDNSRESIIEGVVGLDAPVSGILIDVRDNPGWRTIFGN